MNVVLLADKKFRKPFEAAVKKDPNINLVGVEVILRGNTMSRIADHHNPHALVVYKGVPEKEGITEKACISFLRMVKPNMRIIYIYGKVEDIEAFTTVTEQLISNGITDIVTDTSAEKVVSVIDSPMTEEDVQELIEKLTAPEEEIIHEEVLHEELLPGQEFIPLEVDFPTVTASDKFDIDKIIYEVSETKDSEHMTIGVAQLQHHNGCTHTAFELATMISKKRTVAVIMADDDTFEALAVFHKLNPLAAKQGLDVHGIAVFPYELRKHIVNEYSVVIYDYSFLREEKRKSFDECDIKLMLSSAAEWDIAKKGKSIYPTELGMYLIKCLPVKELKSAAYTGELEKQLNNISLGKSSYDKYIAFIKQKAAEWFKVIAESEGSKFISSAEQQLICPFCGKPLIKLDWGYSCTGYKDGCKFHVNKKIAGKTITENQVIMLCKSGRTAIIKGFKAKSGSTFDAYLAVDEEKQEISFQFPDRRKK
ncbi:MAG: topoisomerase C-terminal repeat-containing protein [Ruminococcus sp.]|uniref:topoisomerase C-terminal repeat-containing protein n=1 Tax=Ruminococcus sp. TaxID=41978 RepID=UPI0025FC4FB2|nr:type IA DNA topoisomerase [Ruminococcus sp.]MCR4795827.1 topoisomerase C-terminal repeat-containing protein [Ruminococcus sp.]